MASSLSLLSPGVPEGDTIHRTARSLSRWLVGRDITDCTFSPAIGQRVIAVEPRGKHLLIWLSGGGAVHSHLGMDGSWHVYSEGAKWRRGAHRARAAVHAGDRVAVCFDAPTAELLTASEVKSHPALTALGPDVLDPGFDPVDAARRARAGSGRSVGEVLMDQQIAAGIGNIWRAELLFGARLAPRRPVGEILEDDLVDVYRTAHRLMAVSVHSEEYRPRDTGGGAGRFWVYRRAGQPCRRCGTAIRSELLGDPPRRVWWCPSCQRA